MKPNKIQGITIWGGHLEPCLKCGAATVQAWFYGCNGCIVQCECGKVVCGLDAVERWNRGSTMPPNPCLCLCGGWGYHRREAYQTQYWSAIECNQCGLIVEHEKEDGCKANWISIMSDENEYHRKLGKQVSVTIAYKNEREHAKKGENNE